MNKVNVTRECLETVAKKAVNLDDLNRLVNELIALLLDKNEKYKDAWQDFGIFTPLLRIREKLIRVENLIDGRPVLIHDEDVRNEMLDVAGYALLCILWMDNQNGEEFQKIINELREDVRK